MLNSIAPFVSLTPQIVALVLALAVAVGMTGSAIEAIGLFLQRFASLPAQRIGKVLEHVGKVLEAVAVDAPKIVTNVAGFVSKLGKLIGVGGAALALVLALACYGLVACTAGELKTQAQLDHDADVFCAGLPKARAERDAIESLSHFTPDAATDIGAAGAP